jgi:SNF2 family DNA or RNA helicase
VTAALSPDLELNDVSKTLMWGSSYCSDERCFDAESIDSLINILPVVRVIEKDNIIRATGFWARDLAHDIKRVWKTQRVVSALFLDLTARTFSIQSFFAIEVDYILTVLMDDPKARTDRMTLQSIRDKLRERTWLHKIDLAERRELHLDNIKRLNVDLLSNQSGFLDVIATRTTAYSLNGQVMASPPGTGKTIGGVATSLALDAEMTLFVVPNNSVHEVWEETLLSRFKKTPKFWLSSSGVMPTGKEEFLVCHYEFLTKLLPMISTFAKKKNFCVWIDESHNFNEIKSKRTQALVRICRNSNATNVVWASGTPFKAMGYELVPILRTIDPMFTEEVEKAFLGIFGTTKGRAVDILRHRIGNFTYRVDKRTVVDNTVINVEHKIKIPNPEPFLVENVGLEIKEFVKGRVKYYAERRSEYAATYERLYAKFARYIGSQSLREKADLYRRYVAKMHKSFNHQDDRDLMRYCKQFEEDHILPSLNNEDRKEYRHVIAVHKYLILVVRGEALGRILVRRRIDCFKAMVEHADLGEIIQTAETKVLIFTSFVEVVKQIDAHLEKRGYDTAVVIGDTNKDFEKIMAGFKINRKINPAIATYKSLSTAVPVVEASDVVLFDLPFRAYVQEQATSRVDRKGQKASRVRIITCTLDTDGIPNLSTRSLDIMKWSRDIVDQMLGIAGNDIEETEL